MVIQRRIYGQKYFKKANIEINEPNKESNKEFIYFYSHKWIISLKKPYDSHSVSIFLAWRGITSLNNQPYMLDWRSRAIFYSRNLMLHKSTFLSLSEHLSKNLST